jgi:hypothetical protein
MKTFNDYLEETIRRYGAVGNSPGMGYTAEDEQADYDSAHAPEQPDGNAAKTDPLLSKSVELAAVPAMEDDDDEELSLIKERAGLGE